MLNNLAYIHRYLMGRIRRIYFMALPESREDLKKSRIYYTTADTAAQTVIQLTGGTFLATIMLYCGISVANIGIITSMVSLAALSQLFLIKLLKRIKKYKFLVCVTALQRVLFAFIYLIPLLAVSNKQKALLICLLYVIGQVVVQISVPASQEWIASLVPSRLRGKYFSIKDSVVVLVVSITMLICGMVFDYYKKSDMVTAFIIVGVIIFILSMINFIAYSRMKEPKTSYVNEDGKEMHGRLAKKAMQNIDVSVNESNILKEIKEAFQDKKFRIAFTIQCIYIFGFYICVPFIPSYQINELALPFTFIMLVNFIVNLYRIYIMPKIGRMADRYGMARLLRYSLLALGLQFLILAFTVPENAYPMFIISAFMSATAWSFINIGLFGIQLDFYKSEKRVQWLTITSSLSGVFGFLVSVVGGSILNFLQKNPIALFGRKLYAQQVLNAAGFLILVGAVFYIKYRAETQKIDTNRKDGRI